jgi:hypothetical protein
LLKELLLGVLITTYELIDVDVLQFHSLSTTSFIASNKLLFHWGLKAYDFHWCIYVFSDLTYCWTSFLILKTSTIMEASQITTSRVRAQEISSNWMFEPWSIHCCYLLILIEIFTFFLVIPFSSWLWSIATYSTMQIMTFFPMIHCWFLPSSFSWMCPNLRWVIVPTKFIDLGVTMVCTLIPCTSNQVPTHVMVISPFHQHKHNRHNSSHLFFHYLEIS